LTADTELNNNAWFNVNTLDLADFALTLDDNMSRLSVAQPVTLDASGEQIVTGAADLSLNGGISVTSGTLSSTGGTLGLPGGATLATGASFSTSNTTLNLGGSLAVADTWTSSTNTSISLTTDNASLSSTEEMSLASLQTNGYDFELASAASDLTIENAFALSGGETLSTQGADLIFESSADISSGSTLDASGGGKLEFQQGGGTDNGTIIAENATFKIGSAYSVTGILKTNSSTTWDLGTSNLDLSGGRLYLGGTVVLDKVLTDNLTSFKLGEDATVTRNQGFTLGGLDLDNSTFTLGSATTDLTIVIGDSSDNGTDSGSPPGTLATQTADLTILGNPSIGTGTTISSTGGTFTFGDGLSISGATVNLQNSTLALGGSFSNTGGSLTLSGTDLELLSNLSLGSDAAFTVDELRLEDKTLNLQSVSSFTVADLLVLDNTNEQVTWDNNTSLALNGGLKLDTNGELTWKNPGNLAIGNITLNGGVFKIGETTGSQTFVLDNSTNLTLTADSEIYFNGGSILNYSGAEVSLGKILTLGGSGQLQNTNDLNLGAGGKLKLSEISVAKVITSANSLGLKIDDNSTITSLSVSNLTPVSITDGKSLSGGITVNTGGTVQLADNGTLASNISMNGGVLDADESLTISGTVTQAGNATIDVASGKTLTFDNGTISTENYQLTLEGAGTVAFPANASGIVLNHADGLLKLNGTGTLGAAQITVASATGKGVQVVKSSTISDLKVLADTELNIASGETLSGSTEIAANKTLSLSGTGTLNSALYLKGTLEQEQTSRFPVQSVLQTMPLFPFQLQARH